MSQRAGRLLPALRAEADFQDLIATGAAGSAHLDGIADALKVNDSRFLPSYEFCEPEAPGRVEVVL